MYRLKPLWMVLACALACAAAGCHQPQSGSSNFRAALNAYYAAHPSCLWPQPVAFPAEADASQADQTRGFDALVEAGLLQWKRVEKASVPAGARLREYSLTEKGRAAWKPSPSDPGRGQFCYGNRRITNISLITSTTNSVSKVTEAVTYNYVMVNVPSWAQSLAVRTAFPDLEADLTSPAPAVAAFLETGHGWKFEPGVAPPLTGNFP